MPEYRVHATMLVRFSIEVDAANEEEAVEKAYNTDLGLWDNDTDKNCDGELQVAQADVEKLSD